MKKTKSFLQLLVFLLLSLSCTESVLNDKTIFDKPLESSVVQKSVPLASANLFAKLLLQSPHDSIILRNRNMNYSIEPVKYANKIVFWLVNYDKGYLLLSANKNKYPIVQYSTVSQLPLSDFSNLENEDLQQLLINYYDDLVNSHLTKADDVDREEKQIFDLWDEIEACLENTDPELEYSIDISFERPETAKPETKSPNGPGTITNRTYKRGYQTVYPMLSKRRWDVYSPYNYNMPKKPHITSGWAMRHTVSSPAIALALIMDYYKIPDAAFWYRQPDTMNEEIETELTKFFSQLSDDLGYQISPSSAEHIDSDRFSKIPSVLNSKYGFVYPSCIEYSPDQAGFDQIRIHLQNFGPAWYITGRLTNNTYVIDGVAELSTKVTIKKKFLGIKYKTITKYYYCDYFHLVNPQNRHDDNWKLYDYDISNKRWNIHVFLLKKKH